MKQTYYVGLAEGFIYRSMATLKSAAITSPFTTYGVAILVIATGILSKKMMRSSPHRRNTNISNRNYVVEQCPNPDCIRCRRYTQVNQCAQRRLPWIIRDLKQRHHNCTNAEGEPSPLFLERIEQAVRLGPKGLLEEDLESNQRRFHLKNVTAADPTARTIGQYPTVLLVRGLSAKPVVTVLHRDACQALEGHGTSASEDKTPLLPKTIILEEYLRSLKHNTDPNTGNDESGIRLLKDGSKRQMRNGGGRGEGRRAGLWLENDVKDDEGRWEVLHLLNQGKWIKENVAQCPKTASFVKGLPGLIHDCIFGNAFISVLKPGTTIDRHCGPSNIRHRLHFALQIPEASGNSNHCNSAGSLQNNCSASNSTVPEMRVLDQILTWTEGSCFVFDDSLMHSVIYPHFPPTTSLLTNRRDDFVNVTASHQPVRAVLVVDLWHPELTHVEREATAQLYPAASVVRT